MTRELDALRLDEIRANVEAVRAAYHSDEGAPIREIALATDTLELLKLHEALVADLREHKRRLADSAVAHLELRSQLVAEKQDAQAWHTEAERWRMRADELHVLLADIIAGHDGDEDVSLPIAVENGRLWILRHSSEREFDHEPE